MSNWIEYTEPYWRRLNMRDLHVDEAYLYADSQSNVTTYLYALSDDCHKCPYTNIMALPKFSHELMNLNVARGITFKVLDNYKHYVLENDTALCTLKPQMNEFGVYNLTINSKNECQFATDKEGVGIYLSMFTVFLIYLALILLYKITKCGWNRWRGFARSTNGNESSDSENPTPPKRRMRSLDAFRGMAIVLMIFANSGGGDYWWIEHATWNGLHLADVVFPSFLWIMGVCIPISVKSQINRGDSKAKICRRILWRSIKLFLIGLCLNSFHNVRFDTLRIMGVLQRFGIAYLICGIVHTIFHKGEQMAPQGRWKRTFNDVILMKGEFVVLVALIAVNLGVLYGAKAPGCPRGYLGPGGKHLYGEHKNCIGGIVKYIDVSVMGKEHIYQHPTAKYTYDSSAFDPEGLFGCVLTVVQVLFGVLGGVTITTYTDWTSRVKRWLSWSVFLGLIGGVLCLFSEDDGWIPLNKNLWSLSFVFVTCSIAFLVLTISYLIIDVYSIWSGTPFVECGMNAIIMYVGHSILHMLPWHWSIGRMNTHFVLLMECVWNTAMWVVIALYLHSVKYYYSV